MADIQPTSSVPDVSAAPAASSTASTDGSQTQDKAAAFQLALSRALNAPQMLADAGGTDDDDDDGSTLKIGLSGGIAVP